MNMPEVIDFLSDYADHISAPVEEDTVVTSVRRFHDGYMVLTNRGAWLCSTLVLASGACNIASIPKIADAIPASVRRLTPLQYQSPDQLDDGGVLVVGASATGVQLAKEIRASGRDVTISVGEHIRLPRIYRGRDIKWWMDVTGVLDMNYQEVEDLNRARKLSSLQLAGSDDHQSLDLNTLSDAGVEIVGRFAGMNEGRAQFSGGLGNMCSLADLKMNRLLESIDEWILEQDSQIDCQPVERFEPTRLSREPTLQLDLNDGGIKTIIWATGFRPDYSWLDVPVFDRKGNLRHDGGIVDAPGMYVLGLPFLRKRNSTLIDGVGDDAAFLADHLKRGIERIAA